MPNSIILKKSSVASKVPVVGDLVYGELALNYADGILYFKKSDGSTIDYFKSYTSNPSFSTLSVSGTSTFSGEVLISNGSGSGGGDEGGELHLAIPTTNTSLNGPIAIDIYQNKLRIFETTGNNRGYFVDITKAANGANSQLRGYSSTTISANTASTTLDLGAYDDFIITLAANTTFALSNIDKKIGSSGTIVLKQDSTGGRTFTKATEMKTPLGGASIAQVTTANSLSVLSYYVVDASTVLINYIGNFA